MVTNKIDNFTEFIETEKNIYYQTELSTKIIDNMTCTDKEIFENKC